MMSESRQTSKAAAMLLLAVAAGVSPVALRSADAFETAETRRVLLVTGEDKHHDWKATAPLLKEQLERDSRLSVTILDDLGKLSSTDLSAYSGVVLHFKNSSPDLPGRKAFDRLRKFVRGGGGLVLVHFACGAFEEFRDEYAEMAGRVWFGLRPPPGRRQHDSRGLFEVRIEDTCHPITEGLANFKTDDELYTCLIGDADIVVLATALSAVDKQSYPMAFTRDFGDGKVFHCTLGHDVRALSIPAVSELYCRGFAWGVGLPMNRPDDASGAPKNRGVGQQDAKSTNREE